MLKLIEEFSVQYGFFVFRIFLFLLVLSVVWFLGKYLVVPFVDRFLINRDMGKHARKPLKTLTRILVVFVGVGIGVGVAGFNSILASLGTIGAAGTIAIGFALKTLIGNFASGVIIFLERSFRIGDWLEWDGHAGVVKDIQLRITRVETFDNEMLTVPNSDLTNSVVKNPVANEQLRIKFLFGIDYGEDIGKATEVILEQAKTIEKILKEPTPSVRLTELDDSQVNLQSRIWIEQPARTDFVKIRSEYIRSVKERFDEEGIEVPFPQRDLSGTLEITKQE